MPPRPDTTRRTRQANLRERRRAAGLVNRNLWLTPEQAATIDAYLKAGTAPPTAASDIQPNHRNLTRLQAGERLFLQAWSRFLADWQGGREEWGSVALVDLLRPVANAFQPLASESATSDALPSKSVDSDVATSDTLVSATSDAPTPEPVTSDDSTSDSSQGAAVADDGDLLTQDEAAALLGVKQRQMQHWRKTGTGPAWQDHGGPGKAMYQRAGLEAWARTWTKKRQGRQRTD